MKAKIFFSGGRDRCRRSVLFVLFGGLLFCGCVFATVEQSRTYSDDEGRAMLRSELVEFERYIESSMKAAYEILQRRNVKADELKVLDAWQKLQRAQFNQALSQKDPLVALADAWAASQSLTLFLSREASIADLPSATRIVALDMLKRREDRLAYIASRYLTEDSMLELSHSIEAFTADQSMSSHKILEPDARKWTAPLFSAWAKSQSAVGSVLKVPLMPGRALKGVSDGGKALADIRETTAEAVQVASQLPESIRAEFQIALADLVEKRAEIIEIVSAIDSVSTNLRATAASSHLTATEVQKSLILAREIVPAGESLAAAVERAVVASTDLVKTIGERPESAEAGRDFDITEYQAAAATITDAASQIRQLLAEVQVLVETGSDQEIPEGFEHFDIRDYGAAAESIQLGTAEIRALLSELCEIVDDEAFCTRLDLLWAKADASAQQTADHARSVIDHLAWRLIQVLAAGFIFTGVYALIKKRAHTK